MRRSWTDRDGTIWEMEVTGISPPEKRIHFLREENADEVVVLTVKDKGWGLINRLTDTELQHLLDEARRNAP